MTFNSNFYFPLHILSTDVFLYISDTFSTLSPFYQLESLFKNHNTLMNFKAILFHGILLNARKCKSNEASNVSVIA